MSVARKTERANRRVVQDLTFGPTRQRDIRSSTDDSIHSADLVKHQMCALVAGWLLHLSPGVGAKTKNE